MQRTKPCMDEALSTSVADRATGAKCRLKPIAGLLPTRGQFGEPKLAQDSRFC